MPHPISLLIKEPGASAVRYIEVYRTPFIVGDAVDSDIRLRRAHHRVSISFEETESGYAARDLTSPDGGERSVFPLEDGTRITAGGVILRFLAGIRRDLHKRAIIEPPGAGTPWPGAGHWRLAPPPHVQGIAPPRIHRSKLRGLPHATRRSSPTTDEPAAVAGPEIEDLVRRARSLEDSLQGLRETFDHHPFFSPGADPPLLS